MKVTRPTKYSKKASRVVQFQVPNFFTCVTKYFLLDTRVRLLCIRDEVVSLLNADRIHSDYTIVLHTIINDSPFVLFTASTVITRRVATVEYQVTIGAMMMMMMIHSNDNNILALLQVPSFLFSTTSSLEIHS
jgi:hypothetical protein